MRTKTYKRAGEQIHVLQELNRDVDQGDFVAFMGPSGPARRVRRTKIPDLPEDSTDRGSITRRKRADQS